MPQLTSKHSRLLFSAVGLKKKGFDFNFGITTLFFRIIFRLFFLLTMDTSVIDDFMSNDCELDDDQPFYFECDHLALKGNSDYLALMRALVHLEALKVQTVQDIDTLLSEQNEALRNPVEFLLKLRSGDVQLPGRIKVPTVPEVDWSRYNLGDEVTKRPLKRTLKSAVTEDNEGSVNNVIFCFNINYDIFL